MENREFRAELRMMWLRKHAENTRVENVYMQQTKDMQRPTGEKVFTLEFDKSHRRTLAQSIGKFMAWMFGIPALAVAALAVGEYFGWWV